MNPNELLSVGQAAKLKGVSRTAVYHAISRGSLPHIRIINHIALREGDVLAWELVRYAGRPGSKGRGGRPKGIPMSAETKRRISEAQKQRWAERGRKREREKVQAGEAT